MKTSVCNRLACASASSRTRESTLTAMVDASVLLVLRIMTALSSFMVSLSPSFSIYKIYQSKTVGNISIVPFVSLLGNAHMWMMYGYFCGNIFPVVVSFGFGDLAALVYISVTCSGGTVSVLATITLYAVIAAAGATGQDYTGISHILGYLSIVAAIILYGAPFEKTSFVLRNKNASPIQLPMVICGATNNALWVIYTPLDRNWFMVIPNAICVVLGIVLLTLYVMYRPSKSVQTAIDLSDDDIAIRIVVSTKTEEIQNKIPNASPSVQPMASPLLPLSRENSFQLGSPSMSRGSSFQQMSSPALSSQSGSFRSSSSDCGFTAGALHINRAPRQK
ncbi:Sugar efflux transporter for intercellular exchange [Phytophthora infestans]|uniref:Sugar efflux transporter for intercellular exchange n=1 Tax=Phytophthora infestans TaxID=4787 RepID=A0A833TD98_PHYIN|nr:Sugar efflux transporter for intercellular exchange [Phytophthora infestans]